VDDLVANVDRRPEPLERELDDLDRAIDAGAKAARRRDKNVKWWLVQHFIQHLDSHVSVRLQP
jgi:hypothetical protein